jgi:hypothetical protein
MRDNANIEMMEYILFYEQKGMNELEKHEKIVLTKIFVNSSTQASKLHHLDIFLTT